MRSPTSPPDVSFIILNWKGTAQTVTCANSILDHPVRHTIEILIVDNESTQSSLDELQGLLPACRIISSKKNLGFTGGMNLGVAHSQAPFIALLNNDLVLPPGWLDVALNGMASNQRAGIIGGKSFAWDDQNPCFDPQNLATTAHIVDPRGGSATLADVELPRCEVASVDGSALFVRRATWERIGGFDESYFAYGEEVDLCARCLAAGWDVLYDPELTSWHRRNLSSDRMPIRRVFMARRNQAKNVAKHFPDRLWWPVVRTLVKDDVWYGLWGRQAGLRTGRAGLKLSLSERLGLLWAAAWVAVHVRQLRAARATVVAQGLHAPNYVDDLRVRFAHGGLAPRTTVADR